MHCAKIDQSSFRAAPFGSTVVKYYPLCGEIMDRSSLEKLRDELERLMREHIELTEKRTFLGITPEEVLQEKERLERIREVSADFLQALKKLRP